MYNSCLLGCRYCYATSSFERARQNYLRHDPMAPRFTRKGMYQTFRVFKTRKVWLPIWSVLFQRLEQARQPDLHICDRWKRITCRPFSSSAWRSPKACASSSTPKVIDKSAASFVGDGSIFCGVGSNLHEQPAPGIAFVELAGGVQEARTVAAGHSQPGALAQALRKASKAGVAARPGWKIGLESDIAARCGLGQEAAPDFGSDEAPLTSPINQRCPRSAGRACSAGSRPSCLVGSHHFTRLHFGRFRRPAGRRVGCPGGDRRWLSPSPTGRTAPPRSYRSLISRRTTGCPASFERQHGQS